MDDDTYYEVEKIVDHAFDAHGMLFRVRWKGYTDKDDTWEDEHCFLDPQYVANYKAGVDAARKNGSDHAKEEDKVMFVAEQPFSSDNGHFTRLFDRIDVSMQVTTSDTSASASKDVTDDEDTRENDPLEVGDGHAEGDASSDGHSDTGRKYEHFLQYRIDWQANRANWKAVQVINERQSSTNSGKELMVRWQHVENSWQTFHSWEPENNLDCYQVMLKYYLDSARASERNGQSSW